MKMYGPYRLEMKVAVTDGNGTSGEVTLTVGEPGNPPKPERISELIKVAEEAVVDMIPGGRLMTKEEFFDFLMEEKTGVPGKWATPGGPDWDHQPAD